MTELGIETVSSVHEPRCSHYTSTEARARFSAVRPSDATSGGRIPASAPTYRVTTSQSARVPAAYVPYYRGEDPGNVLRSHPEVNSCL